MMHATAKRRRKDNKSKYEFPPIPQTSRDGFFAATRRIRRDREHKGAPPLLEQPHGKINRKELAEAAIPFAIWFVNQLRIGYRKQTVRDYAQRHGIDEGDIYQSAIAGLYTAASRASGDGSFLKYASFYITSAIYAEISIATPLHISAGTFSRLRATEEAIVFLETNGRTPNAQEFSAMEAAQKVMVARIAEAIGADRKAIARAKERLQIKKILLGRKQVELDKPIGEDLEITAGDLIGIGGETSTLSMLEAKRGELDPARMQLRSVLEQLVRDNKERRFLDYKLKLEERADERGIIDDMPSDATIRTWLDEIRESNPELEATTERAMRRGHDPPRVQLYDLLEDCMMEYRNMTPGGYIVLLKRRAKGKQLEEFLPSSETITRWIRKVREKHPELRLTLDRNTVNLGIHERLEHRARLIESEVAAQHRLGNATVTSAHRLYEHDPRIKELEMTPWQLAIRDVAGGLILSDDEIRRRTV